MELDEQQEWRTFSRRTAEQAKILHEELTTSGLHQDLCWKGTLQFIGAEIAREKTILPDINFKDMNSLITEMLKAVRPEDEE